MLFRSLGGPADGPQQTSATTHTTWTLALDSALWFPMTSVASPAARLVHISAARLVHISATTTWTLATDSALRPPMASVASHAARLVRISATTLTTCTLPLGGSSFLPHLISQNRLRETQCCRRWQLRWQSGQIWQLHDRCSPDIGPGTSPSRTPPCLQRLPHPSYCTRPPLPEAAPSPARAPFYPA